MSVCANPRIGPDQCGALYLSRREPTGCRIGQPISGRPQVRPPICGDSTTMRGQTFGSFGFVTPQGGAGPNLHCRLTISTKRSMPEPYTTALLTEMLWRID